MVYKKYVGNSFVKRFYAPFEQENIYKILDFRDSNVFSDGEFLYDDGTGEWWGDIEDSIIITNEEEISQDTRVFNVKSAFYIGYNPYTKMIVAPNS